MQGRSPDRSAVEVQYILHIHFSDSAVYTTGTLQLEGSIHCIAGSGPAVYTAPHCIYTALRSGRASISLLLAWFYAVIGP